MGRVVLSVVLVCSVVGCAARERRVPAVGDGGIDPWGDAGPTADSGSGDAGRDPGASDAGRDAGASDGGRDAGTGDAGRDGGASDAGWDGGPSDAGRDAGPADAGRDAGPADAGWDAGPAGGCVSGATGTHAVRFEWAGSGPGSTAYVRYLANELPDTSRWRVTAASMSIGYRPEYGDTFLGDGGLVLEGTTFIDVELSTAGLSSLRGVTLAVRGRSYNTTASGSFSWQTFDGMAATAPGSVWNSAPYRWYAADATPEFSPGDSGVLLRIRAGPPSGSLIVHRVEICFDAS